MRLIHSGLFSKLKQAGINDRFRYMRSYYDYSGVYYSQKAFQMIISVLSEILQGVKYINKILRMGFPNKRISCKRKRRNQY